MSDLSFVCGWAGITKRDANGWWEITGGGTRKKGVIESLPESRKVKMDERWHGSLFQIFGATDENDLDFVTAVFRVETHIDKEEDRSDRVGTYREIRAVR